MDLYGALKCICYFRGYKYGVLIRVKYTPISAKNALVAVPGIVTGGTYEGIKKAPLGELLIYILGYDCINHYASIKVGRVEGFSQVVGLLFCDRV